MKAPIMRSMGTRCLAPKRLAQSSQLELARRLLPAYRRSFHISARRSEEDQSGKRSFRGQLYESTHDRLERERAEDEKYRRIRAAREGSGPRNAAVMVCTSRYATLVWLS